MREWDPRTASSAEIEALLELLNAILAVDLPDDPPWRVDSLREYLAETMPGQRRISWIVTEEPGESSPAGAPGKADSAGPPGGAGAPARLLGHVNILLLGDIGVLEVLVHPSARHTGVGRRLIATAARRAYQEGFSSLGAEVVGGTPAVAFYEALGFRCEYVETRGVLRLAGVDWESVRAMATEIDERYRIEYCPGGPPDELLEAYARAKAQARDDADDGDDLDLRPSSYDPQRLRDSIACLHRRGMKPYIVVAVEEQTGDVAGLTELVVPAQHPTRADQYDTIVAPAHQGNGIERAIKARMLLELRKAEPRLREVQTWNTSTNEPMLKVNAELGFRPDREWCEYGIDLAELMHRLDHQLS